MSSAGGDGTGRHGGRLYRKIRPSVQGLKGLISNKERPLEEIRQKTEREKKSSGLQLTRSRYPEKGVS